MTTQELPATAADDATVEDPPFDVRAVFRLALIVIPLGVLGNLLFSLLGTDRGVLTAVAEAPRQWLGVALGLALLPWLTNTLRLLIWTDFLDVRIGFREAFRMTLAVDLGAAVSPTAVGGGFLKWGLLVERGVRPGTAASLTAFPIIEDGIFFALALPAAVLATAAWELGALETVGGAALSRVTGLVAIGAAIFLVLWLIAQALLRGGMGLRVRHGLLRRIVRVRRRISVAWRDARAVFSLVIARGKARLVLSLTLTAVQWGARYSVITALAAFLGAPVKPVLFWLLQWVVFTLMTLTPTPGAAGGAEVSFLVVYGALLPAGVLAVATAGWRFMTFYLQVGLAAVLFPLLGVRRGRTGR